MRSQYCRRCSALSTSIVIDAPPENNDTPLPELSWVGQTATIGSATVEFVIACPRCVMVTRAIDDSVGEDREVLRYVVRELNQDVGVYANIIERNDLETTKSPSFKACV